MNDFVIAKIKIIVSVLVAVATITLVALSVGISTINAQLYYGETDTQQVGVVEFGGVTTTEDYDVSLTDGVDRPSYRPNNILIFYEETQSPVLVNEDETGTVDLSEIEANYLNSGLAVISEDLASVGVDTAGVEIYGGDSELNGYYVRFDSEIDPLQLSFQLNEIEGINWAQPNYLYYPAQGQSGNDPERNHYGSWWINDINLDDAHIFWDNHKDTSQDAPKVAVIEVRAGTNGFAVRSPEYYDHLWDSSSCTLEPVLGFIPNINRNCGPNGGRDFADSNDDDPGDGTTYHHGTWVTSILAGKKGNPHGAYGVYQEDDTVMLLRFAGSSDYLAEAIKFADRNDAKVINGSFGTDLTNSLTTTSCRNIRSHPTITDGAVHSAIRNFPGLYVASAGNQRMQISDEAGLGEIIRHPQIYAQLVEDDNEDDCFEALPNFINVAGTETATSGIEIWDTPTSQTTRGSNYSADYVQIAAPAHNIALMGQDGDFENVLSGTSFAAPQVAGVAAMMLSINPNLEPDELIQIINETGKGILPTDKVAGGKSLDAEKAVHCAYRLRGVSDSNFDRVLDACEHLIPPAVRTNRDVEDVEDYIDRIYPNAEFTKTITFDPIRTPTHYNLERRRELPDRWVSLYNYRVDVPEETRSVWRRVTVTRTRPVTERVCVRHTGIWPFRRCAEWETREVTERYCGYRSRYSGRCIYWSTRVVMEEYQTTEWQRVTEVVREAYSYEITNTFRRNLSLSRYSNYTRVGPYGEWRTPSPSYEWVEMRNVHKDDVQWPCNGNNARQDRNCVAVRWDTEYPAPITVETDYEGGFSSRDCNGNERCEDNLSALRRAPLVVRVDGRRVSSSTWRGIVRDIESARDHDRDILRTRDGSLLTIYDASSLVSRRVRGRSASQRADFVESSLRSYVDSVNSDRRFINDLNRRRSHFRRTYS